MKKKVTLLTVFVLLLSSLTMLKAQNNQPPLTQGGLKALFGALISAGRAVENEKKPLGRLLTGEAHRDVRPLIIEYVATAPTFIDAVAEIVPLASMSKDLREASIQGLANRIEREAGAEQKGVKSYATGLLFDLVQSGKPVPLIAVEAIKSAGADVNEYNDYGHTPLHAAAKYGHKESVDALIKAGADVNAQALIGRFTPLHMAVGNGRKEIVQKLLAAGADKKIKNYQGQTAYDYAVHAKSTEIKKLLE